ncbi:hypothetical protein EDB99_10759 [Pseudomonas sp. 460]|nr:hypothetical protein EDB99_10759 [Pseudomonas sp. 460]
MKILCLLGRHNFQIAHGHPDGKMGYCIHECTRCSSRLVLALPSSLIMSALIAAPLTLIYYFRVVKKQAHLRPRDLVRTDQHDA